MTDKERAEAAIRQLLASDRGSIALAGLREWLNAYGFGLDAKNQEAISALLILAWGPLRGTVSQMIATATAQRCEHGIEDYEYCEQCSKEYKRAAREAGLED